MMVTHRHAWCLKESVSNDQHFSIPETVGPLEWGSRFFDMQMGFGEAQMLDKVLYEEEVRRLVFTFEQQFHYGVFFAYMRLREQEIRNVMWIAECIAQDQKSRINDGIVLIF